MSMHSPSQCSIVCLRFDIINMASMTGVHASPRQCTMVFLRYDNINMASMTGVHAQSVSMPYGVSKVCSEYD